jgi:predicted RNA-binding Zn ribbon-like protein
MPEIRRVSLSATILRLKMSAQSESVLALDSASAADGFGSPAQVARQSAAAAALRGNGNGNGNGKAAAKASAGSIDVVNGDDEDELVDRVLFEADAGDQDSDNDDEDEDDDAPAAPAENPELFWTDPEPVKPVKKSSVPSSLAASFAGVLSDPEKVLADTLEPPELSSIQAAFVELVDAGALVNSSVTTSAAASASAAAAASDAVPLVRPSLLKDPKSRSKSSKSSSSSDAPSAMASPFATAALTPLGRFLAHLPFSFELGRAIAYAASFDARLLPHTVIVAAALSQQEVFVSPHPRMTDTQRFASMVAHSTYGRLAFDRGRLSDMISSVELVRQYTTVQYAIAAARLRGEQSANATNFALIKSLMARAPQLFAELHGEHVPMNDAGAAFNFLHGVSFDRYE